MVKVAAGIYLKQASDTLMASGEPDQIRNRQVPARTEMPGQSIHKPGVHFDAVKYLAEKKKAMPAVAPKVTPKAGVGSFAASLFKKFKF